MKKILKKIGALVCAIAMVMTTMPSIAYAEPADASTAVAKIADTEYTSLNEAIAAAQSGDTVDILQAGTYTLPNIPESITVKGDVDGVVFDETTYGYGSVANIPNGATFENVTFKFSNDNYHGFWNAGTINMNNCTIEGKLFSYGDMNFTKCTFNQTASDYCMWAYAGNLVYDGCTFNVNGKTINVYNEGVDATYTVTVKNCEFNSTQTNKAALNVKETCGSTVLSYVVTVENCTTNGNFPEASESETLTVINGLVQVDDKQATPSTEGSNIVVTVDGEQVYSTPAKAYAAQIGDTKYETLQEAFDAAQSGDTLEILQAGTYTLPDLPENITVKGDVDGVVFDETAVGYGASVASVPNGATFENVTFKFSNDNYHGFQHAGTINMKNCTIEGKLFSYADMNFTNCTFNQTESDYCMWAYAGNLVYEGCTFNVNGKTINVYNEDGSTTYSVTVKNCEFNSTQTNKAALNVKETCGSKVLSYVVDVENCTTNENFPAASDNGTLTVISGLVQVDDKQATPSTDGGNIVVKVDGEQVYSTPGKVYAAKIGDKKYETIADAVAAAVNADDIELLDDEGKTVVTIDYSEMAFFGSTYNAMLCITSTADDYVISGEMLAEIFEAGAARASSCVQVYITGEVTIDVAGYTESDKLAGMEHELIVTGDDTTGGSLTLKNSGTVTVLPEFENINENAKVVDADGIYAATVTSGSKSVYYQTFADAVAAATDGQTVTLLKDIEEAVTIDKAVTVEGNGFEIKADGDAVTVTASGVKLNEVKAVSKSGHALVAGTQAAPIEGVITVNGGSYTDETPGQQGEGAIRLFIDGDVTVKDASLTGGLHIFNNNPGTLDISGNTFDVDESLKDRGDIICGILVHGSNTESVDGPALLANNTFNAGDANYKVRVENDSWAAIYSDKGVASVDGIYYDTLEAAVTAANKNGTITLLKNCSGNGIKIASGSNLTFDFAGYTYTIDGATVGSTGTETNGFQLLKDSDITFRNGTITSSKAQILTQNYSNLTLDKMTLDGSSLKGTSPYPYTLSNNNGEITINDTTIIAADGGTAFDVCRYSSYKSVSVTVTGESKIQGAIELYASNNDAGDGFALTLESGDFSESSIRMTSGAALATVTKDADVAIAAPQDYKWVDNKLVAKDYVAQLGDNKYESLAEAVADAKSGDTITLLKDCAGNGIKVKSGNDITIDFGGYTYTIDGATVGSTGTETNGFQLLKDSDITFRNGTITSSKAQILIQNYSNLTLDKMTLDGSSLKGTSPYPYTLSNNNGEITINDTTIIAADGGTAFDVCRYSSYKSVSVTVTGESKIQGAIELYASNNDAGDGFALTLESGDFSDSSIRMASGAALATVTKSDDVELSAPQDYKWVDGKLTAKVYVAQTGDEKFESVEEAITAAKGATVKLLADAAPTVVLGASDTCTFDLNGYTLDVTGITPDSEDGLVVETKNADETITYSVETATEWDKKAQDQIEDLQDQIDDINDAIEALDDTYATDAEVAEKLADAKKQAEAAKEALVEAQKAVDDAQDTDIASNKAAIEEANAAIEAADDAIDALKDSTAEALKEAVQALKDGEIKDNADAIAALQTAVKALEDTYASDTELAEAVSAAKTEVKAYVDEQDQKLQEAIDKANAAIEANDAAIKALDDTYATDKDVAEKLEAAKAQAEEAKAALVEAQKAVDDAQDAANKAAIEEANAAIEAADDAIDALKDSTAEALKEAVQALKDGDIAENAANITALQDAVSKLDDTYATDSEMAKAVENAETEVKTYVDNQVKTLKEVIAANESAINALDSTYATDAEVAAKIEEAKKAIASADDTAAAAQKALDDDQTADIAANEAAIKALEESTTAAITAAVEALKNGEVKANADAITALQKAVDALELTGMTSDETKAAIAEAQEALKTYVDEKDAALQQQIDVLTAQMSMLLDPVTAKAKSKNYKSILVSWTTGAADGVIIDGVTYAKEDALAIISTPTLTGTKYSYTITPYIMVSGTQVLGKSVTVTGVSKLSTGKIKKAVAGKAKVTLKWKKVSGSSGYQITYKASGVKAKTITVKKGKTIKKVIKKLKSGKKYTFKIRAYRKVNGKKVYGKWSKAKSVKVK